MMTTNASPVCLDNRPILDTNGALMSAYTIQVALDICKQNGSVVIRGVPGVEDRVFTNVRDLEILRDNADLFY